MTKQFHDGAYRLVQAGSGEGVQLVRITALLHANLYSAKAVDFDSQSRTQIASDRVLTVLNLAEPADAPGQVEVGTEAVAVEAEGHWIIFLRKEQGGAFPAKVIAASGGGTYSLRPQEASGAGTFADVRNAADITAWNLAELALGSGSALDIGAIVLVTTIVQNSQPPVTRYVFDHPAYAKYLD